VADVWEESFRGAYAREVAEYQKASPEGKARIMAMEDSKGTGDLLREALRVSSSTPLEGGGGVKRLFGMMRRGHGSQTGIGGEIQGTGQEGEESGLSGLDR
jgi:hypothetical protein